jgi:hypothetical protein
MRIPALLALALLFVAVITAAARVPEGGLRPHTPEDLGPEPRPGRTHNEFWTWQFLFGDGIQAQLNISRVHFGSFKDPVSGADLALMGFRGRNHFVAREYPLRNFSWDPSTARLGVHANIHAEGFPPGEHRVRFATRKDGRDYLLELAFEAMTPGVVWGDGEFRVGGGERISLFLHVPRAKVHGRIAVDGDTLEVRGVGWMDHTRQTQFGTRLMDAGYRYVVTSGRVEGGYFFQNGSSVFGYGVRVGPAGPELLRPQSVTASERSSWGGHFVPGRLEFGLEGRPPVTVARVESRQRTSVLQELGSFERMGARMFLGGELFGYRGLARVDDSLPAVFSYTMVRR